MLIDYGSPLLVISLAPRITIVAKPCDLFSIILISFAKRIWTASRASCRSTAMPATAGWPIVATSALRSARCMYAATFTRCPGPSAIVSEALERIAAVYAVEKDTAVVMLTSVEPSATEKPSASRRVRALGCMQSLV